MTRDEWVAFGQNAGYISREFCVTHDGTPNTAEEDAQWDDGGDPCCFVVRLLHPDMGPLSGGREGWPA